MLPSYSQPNWIIILRNLFISGFRVVFGKPSRWKMNPSFAVVPSRPDDERSHTELHTEESEGVGHLPKVLHWENLQALAVTNGRVDWEIVKPLLKQESPLDTHNEGVQKNLDDSTDVPCAK